MTRWRAASRRRSSARLAAPRPVEVTTMVSQVPSQGSRTGYLVESGPTKSLFESPREQLTKEYVSGQFS